MASLTIYPESAGEDWWGRGAVLASRLEVGSAVSLMGRIQSREYVKNLSETEAQMRVAYEVSVTTLEPEA